jgi:tetratricopeptide (TPR) repeat protein
MIALRGSRVLAVAAFSLQLVSFVASRVQDEEPAIPPLNVSDFQGELRLRLQEALARVKGEAGSAEASGAIGMLLFAHEQLELAAPWFRRAAVLAPREVRWRYYLGTVLSDLGRHDDAIAPLRESVRLDPRYLPSLHKLADTLLAAGDLEEAGAVYTNIATTHPEVATAHYGLGRIEAARRNPAAAAEHYLKACALYPQFGAAHYGLALAYRQRGELQKTREHLRLYESNRLGWPVLPDSLLGEIASLRSDASSLLRRGIQAEAAGDLAGAIAEHERAVERDPAHASAHLNLITLYGKTGQVQNAELHYRAALRLGQNLADAHFNYGVILAGLGKYSAAAGVFGKALEINPYHADAHNNLGYILMMEGKLNEAAAHYRSALENRPGYRVAHFNLGRILVAQGRIREAIEHFEQTLSPQDEETPTYLHALGAAYARDGDRVSALRYIKDARTKAEALGRTDLLPSIDRDLSLLERKSEP